MYAVSRVHKGESETENSTTNQGCATVEVLVPVVVEEVNTQPSSKSPQVFDEIFRWSCSMTHYEKNFVFDLFEKDE